MDISILENTSDVISRQAAIDALHMHLMYRMGTDSNKKRLDEWINNLPPVQSERIKGHWIESAGQNILLKKLIEKGETWRVCDKCGAGFMIGYQYECDKLYHETFHNFCPKCGAEMDVTT
jgi:hypothetical protein